MIEDHSIGTTSGAQTPSSMGDCVAAPVDPLGAHSRIVLTWLKKLNALRAGVDVIVDGESLDIPSVVAVAKFGARTKLDESESTIYKINKSVEVLIQHLREDKMVYGVNTGFGGSADARTRQLEALQAGLIQHQQSGILTKHDIKQTDSTMGVLDDNHSTMMPKAWAKGLMLVRLNSLIRGHSAVSMPTINAILGLLEHRITPIIPKRGSISASGDLSPLSYVAGALQGSPDVFVHVDDRETGSRTVSADEALRSVEMKPIVLGAKEGLGLLNGTAASASVASLALYECNHLILLSQVLTAMGCEAIKGTVESYHPFISEARPHRGQKEVAANVFGFLTGSRLAQNLESTKYLGTEGLAQDRYTFRTASQWLGPQIEDLLLAIEQVTVELNSTTDNPLVDISSRQVHHGGNFQAASVTSAMEKSRLAMQMSARLLFTQATEIINTAMNRGLPANLCADDPSVSSTAKGIDISLAAYYSEIAFLSNPVSTHVQSAEMHNQAVNSLALISGRYTLEVVDIMNKLCAAYLFVVCQALDLRVLQHRFLEKANTALVEMTGEIIGRLLVDPAHSEDIIRNIWNSLVREWDSTTTLDLQMRAKQTADSVTATLMREMRTCSGVKASASELFEAVEAWTTSLSTKLRELYDSTRMEMFNNHNEITPTYLGRGTTGLYSFVRKENGIPFHHGLVDDPSYVLQDGQQASSRPEERKTIGSHLSTIYEGIRSGKIHDAVIVAVEGNMA